ncbi:MAG: glycosyltransferase family 4 protein [Candidatus Pacebacteria bacterium]|nr:glycosyltransferase family 4 protein [Candidatus Paceibacterota bacterium]
MKILIHDFAGHGYSLSLSRQLAFRGHRVLHLYCADYPSPHGDLGGESVAGLTVEAIACDGAYRRPSPMRRLRDDRAYARLLAARGAEFKPEVILGGNGPLAAQSALIGLARRQGIPFVYWLQDLYGLAVTSLARERLGWLVGGLLGWCFKIWEGRLWRKSAAIIAISSDFTAALTRAAIPMERVTIIQNWADLAAFAAVSPAAVDSWKESQGLTGQRLILYAGTLGFKHDPQVLVRLAAALANYPRESSTDLGVTLVVATEGRGRAILEGEKQALGLTRLHLLDYVPAAEFATLLAAAEFGLVILAESAGAYSMPSKSLSYAAAGRAILAELPRGNLVARLVEQAGMGEVVSPDSGDELARRVFDWLDQPRLVADYGRNGRAYAEQAFAMDGIADRFERILVGSE